MNLGFIENSINLIWDRYEGFFYDAYYINGFSAEQNEWVEIDVIPGSPEDAMNSYTVFDMSNYTQFVVTVDKGIACQTTALKASAGPFSQSLSNIEDNRLRQENSISLSRADAHFVQLYPNPTRDVLYIEAEEEIDELLIINAKGQKSPIQVTSGKPQQVNLSTLPRGSYLIQITQNGVNTYNRIVLE